MRALFSFQNLHQNKTVVVCGCGESLNDLERPERFITIGVNDVGRRFQPNYLVVVNPKNQFSGDRFGYVETSKAEYLFTQLDLGVTHPKVVKFPLGQFGGTDFSDRNVLHYTNNSPYIAVCLAILMGAKRIGLIGVDFTDHHFYAKTGRHPLAAQFETINGQYERLAKAAESNGIEIFNLSAISRLTAFPKMPLGEFENLSTAAPEKTEKTESLKIVSYATTPVAGVPAILARCIAARTTYSARCVWATNDYGNGVRFAGDVEWQNQPSLAESLLAEADLIIVHNGKVAAEHEKLFKDRAILTMAHNYLWNVDERFFKSGFPGAVVGQYQAALEGFKNWAIVPNPIPFWEAEYQPETKPDQITICYTPSGRHEQYPAAHRLYWHSKGYATTMKILEKLAKQFPVKLEVIGDRQISHVESLAMKRRSHIVIDECVTGSYHRNSLEGLAGGCAVVNGLGILPKVVEVLQICAGESAKIPFVLATLETLEDVLIGLIESGRKNLIQRGAENRRWLETHWDFTKQWEKFWLPVIEKSFVKVDRKIQKTDSEKSVSGDLAKEVTSLEMEKFKPGVSVVIPHGGANRLPHLRTCLANLRQCAEVGEVIVVEMDAHPTAIEIARRWADKYVFLRKADSFERGRVLNVGSAFAECEFVLWLDNDLLVAPDFISRAASELNARNLDFLTPYSAIKYLSQTDSERVMQGVGNPNECRPANVYYSNMTDGGAGLVRRNFLRQNGGIPAGFRGWGGEDNGWMHKVCLLGKGGRTQAGDQTAFHLYHHLSGGYGGDAHLNANPHYQTNLAVLKEIKSARNPQNFLENFPPAPDNLWEDGRRICFVGVAEQSANAARKMFDLFAAPVETISAAELNGFLKQPSDAIVFFDCRAAFDFLNDDSFAHLGEKTLVVADKNCALTTAEIEKLRQCFGVLATDKTIAEKLRQRNIKHWIWNGADGADADFQSLAIALAQPLSLLINAPTIAAVEVKSVGKSAAADLPVWFYWEGKRPDWIEACHQTILAKTPNARFLTTESFADLWTTDRDVDIERLHVAHRADFIRAFLLAKFGGLWIDADCLVMRDLKDTLAYLDDYDFVAHRERSGYFSNGFIAAKRESVIAKQFYETLCQILRSKSTLGWISLGGEPLTKVLQNTEAVFLELNVEQVQPICWSEPWKFFASGSEAEHQNAFDERAICYMLSNREIGNYRQEHPQADLTVENTFFSFLARRALNGQANGGEMASRNGNSQLQIHGNRNSARSKNKNENRRREISFYLKMFDKIAPRKILDADVGLGRWAFLLRDLFESSTDKNSWQMRVEALAATQPKPDDLSYFFYDRVRVGALDEHLKSTAEKTDLLILGDYLAGKSPERDEKILEQTLDFSDYILLNVSRKSNGSAASNNNLNLQGYLESHPEFVAAYQANEDSTSFLLSQLDPKNLRPKSRLTGIFHDMTRLFTEHRMESVSGPGSSLAQTAEIRRRLPILFASLEINSLLDAPCGDYNWLSKVDLRWEKYVGVDVVPSVIEQNRQRYANQNRKFYAADITKDFLPRCDLILCRDCLVHLSLADIRLALRNFRDSGAKYLLTTTFPKRLENADIQNGDWRTLNFQLPPFNFPPPLLLNEHCTEGNGKFADKSLGLWKLSEIE